MYVSDKIKIELEYFRKLHETFSIRLGKRDVLVREVDENVLFMLLSASISMDVSEEEFFENFVITDKFLTNKQEYLIDAYALIDTEDSKEKHLHFFQFKLYENEKGAAASVKDVFEFATLINHVFLHPELNKEYKNEVINEIKQLVDGYLQKNIRKNKIKYKCHFINNNKGITSVNKKDFELLNSFNFDKQTYSFDIQVYGLKEIEDLAIDGKINVGMETIVLENDGEHAFRIEDNSKKTGIGLPGKSIIGIINVNELIRLQNKYHRNQLYSENIRLYLGDRQTVNRDIIKTISSDESLWFPYMNNGISIICEKLVIGIPTQKGLNIEMNNMQIINGCQTVNALYNAKYGEETKDNFKSSKVLIKIYEIDSTQERFKLSVIKATNNQNAVKPSSLVANDLIQISIQAKMKVLGYLYDRKGESKLIIKSTKPINMINAALAYRAVFWFAAQQLRSGIGQGKVFKDDEYKKLFKQEYLEVDQELKFNEFVIKLLISTLILDNIRELITLNSIKFKDFAIFKKSLYYLSGFYYAKYFSQINELILEVTNLLAEENYPKIKNFQKLDDFQKQISSNFFSLVNDFKEFYSNLTIDKSDIDNLLKSSQFGKAYLEIPEIKNITLLNLS